jgi:SagB-type dehydrogenase family enzyme
MNIDLTAALPQLGAAVILGALLTCAPGHPTTGPAAPESVMTVGEQIVLPKVAYTSSTSVEQTLLKRRSVRSYQKTPLSLAEVGQLLWAAQGITHPDGLRTAPSAGALYPLEVHLVAGLVDGLATGIYRYDPHTHALTLVALDDRRAALRQAALGQNAVQEAAALIALTAVYERTTVKYGERGVRYVHMEVGAAAQNVSLQAVSLGLGTVYIGAFDDDLVKEILALATDEYLLCLLPVGRPAP